MTYLPTREQWLAVGFLSIWGYVLIAGEGKPCTTYAYMWVGEAITFATTGLALYVVISMIAERIGKFWASRRSSEQR